MLRTGFLAVAIPVLTAGSFLPAQIASLPTACISDGARTVALATGPWQQAASIAFTDDPARATTRIRLTDDPLMADFAISDDNPASSAGEGCNANPSQRVAIADAPRSGLPVVYLTRDDGDAAYVLFVRSQHISVKEAAALLVGARAMPTQMAALARDPLR